MSMNTYDDLDLRIAAWFDDDAVGASASDAAAIMAVQVWTDAPTSILRSASS